MQIHTIQLLLKLAFVFLINTIITYYLIVILELNWIQTFIAITILIIASGYLVNYITPIRNIMNVLKEVQQTQILNLSLFGSANLFIGWLMLYQAYGLQKTAIIGFGTPIVAGIITGFIEYAFHSSKYNIYDA